MSKNNQTNNLKYPKKIKLNLSENILNENDFDLIKSFSDNYKNTQKTINPNELKQILLSTGLEENNRSYNKIISVLNTNEFQENGIPIDLLKETVMENLWNNGDKLECDNSFNIFLADPDKNYLDPKDFIRLAKEIDFNYEEEEISEMVRECTQMKGENFTFEDFYLLMSSK